jgi:single-strand DNA-binding protein
MAKDLNKVMIIGRLGKDPEMRYTPSGNPVTTFSVAASRQWKDSSTNEGREETEWFSVVAWNKLAEICNEYLKKGARVYIEGRLQTRSWDDQNTGDKRYKTEVIANDMIILDQKGGREGGSGGEYGRNAPDITDDDIPF